MKDDILVTFLKIVRDNGNIQELIKCGLEYYQISEYINLALVEEYVIIQEDKLVITKKGNEKVISANTINSNRWIRPLDEKRVKKLDKYDIYIPLK